MGRASSDMLDWEMTSTEWTPSHWVNLKLLGRWPDFSRTSCQGTSPRSNRPTH